MTDQIPDASTMRAFNKTGMPRLVPLSYLTIDGMEPIYAEYQAKTTRAIPLFELRRTEGQAGS